MNNLDHISEILESIFGVKILKFFEADLGSGILGWKNYDPGSGMEKIGFGINIQDPQHWSTGNELTRGLLS